MGGWVYEKFVVTLHDITKIQRTKIEDRLIQTFLCATEQWVELEQLQYISAVFNICTLVIKVEGKKVIFI